MRSRSEDDPLRVKQLEGSARTLGRNTPASVQRNRVAESGDGNVAPQPARPRLSESVTRAIPSAPMAGAEDTSSPMGSAIEDGRISFADSAEFVTSEEFTGERELNQLMHEPDSSQPPSAPARTSPTQRK